MVSKIQREIEDRNKRRDDIPRRGDIPVERFYNKEEEKFFFNFMSAPKIELHGSKENIYNVKFVDNDSGEVMIEHNDVKTGEWVQAQQEYYINWAISVTNDEGKTTNYTISPENKKVYIVFESNALGDTLAWVPIVELFRKKYKAEVTCSTFHNGLFKDIYKDIKFIERGVPNEGMEMCFKIGWFGDGKKSYRNKYDCHERNLQQIAMDILGLDFETEGEQRPVLQSSGIPRQIKKKYVAITTCSTAQFKYWNRAGGWQEIVNYLKKKGYEVVNIGKQPNNLYGVINKTGKLDMKVLMNIMEYSHFFIGLPSGLSWLSWAMNKKSIMITGISENFCEFQKDIYRVENMNVCHGCFNWKNAVFDRGNWLYCPENEGTEKHFECTATITPQMVKKKIAMVEKHIKKNISTIIDKNGNITNIKNDILISKRGE